MQWPSTFTLAKQSIIDDEIAKLLAKKTIKPSQHECIQFISPIFTTPKKDGSHRLIFNLKVLNRSVAYYQFKMDTLETAIRLMTPGCFMASIDLRDAYYSVPIASEHQKYLKFFWPDQLYAFNCLPIGLTSSRYLGSYIVYQSKREIFLVCLFGNFKFIF